LHAADADDRDLRAERGAQRADHAVARRQQRSPRQPAGLVAVFEPAHRVARRRRVGRDHAVDAAAPQGRGDPREFGVVEVGGDLHEDRHRRAAPRGELGAARVQRAEQRVERLVVLQRAQIARVGARDVDRDVIGMRVDRVEPGEIVGRRALDRRRRVLADVEADDAARGAKTPRLFDVGDEGVDAVVVEPEAVDQRLRLGQPEEPRLRVAGLRLRRHGADFDEAEAERAEPVDAAAVLVEPGGEPDPVRELEPRDGDRIGDARLRPQALHRRALPALDRFERELVRALGVEAEKQRAGERIGDERHRSGLSPRLAIIGR
jgi:hypothetical protein